MMDCIHRNSWCIKSTCENCYVYRKFNRCINCDHWRANNGKEMCTMSCILKFGQDCGGSFK